MIVRPAQLLRLVPAPLLFAAVTFAQPPQAPAPTNSLTVQRVAVEPDQNQRAQTLRWSPDSSRVGWLRWADQSSPLHRALPQQEVWGLIAEAPLAPSSAQTSSDLPDSKAVSDLSSTRSAEPVRLISAAEITSALRGTTPFKPRAPDDDENLNPFLLHDFAWSNDHQSLLLIGETSIAWFDTANRKARTLVSGDDDLTDVALAPNGATISFVRNHSLCLIPSSGGVVRKLASSPRPDILQGELDWPYRNELHLSRAYWWSPDSSALAYLQIDDQAVAKYTLKSSEGETRDIVYPKPGGNLPVVQVFIKPAAGGTPVKIDLGDTKNSYVARICWLPDHRHLAIQRLDRRQQQLQLLLADATTGKVQTILTESEAYWINVSDDWHFFRDGHRFLWSSQHDNYRHLFLYDLSGKRLLQLTRGDWEITHVDAVDEAKGLIYFTSTRKSPLERQVSQVNVAGGDPADVTQQAGTHEPAFAPDAHQFIDSFSSHADPGHADLVSLDQASQNADLTRVTVLPEHPQPENTSKAAHPTPPAANPEQAPTSLPSLEPVEFLTIRLHQGATAQALIIRPPDFNPDHKYPVIVCLAGGPGEQFVRDKWSGSTGLWMQLMAQQGFVVFAMDNQGTAARGHFFEEPIHLRLGAQEMTDQRDAVEFLKRQTYVDPTRLGVYGWGYGGFLAIHAMLDRPVPFKAGFAGAAVTDWHLYDAVFAERYLDDPVLHADGWDASSALDNARYFKGTLMLAQGTEDEFVHQENLLALQDRLLDNGKSAQILLFADRGHLVDDTPARIVLFKNLTDFFVKNL